VIARRSRARARGEAGVSLIELLIAISITGILMAPIGAAIYFGFRTTGATQARVAESDGANILASYFVPDLQGSVAAATNATESPAACGGAGATVDLLVTTSFAPATSVSYYRGTGANASILYRRTCSAGVVTGVARVLSNLDATSSTPIFTCNPADCTVSKVVRAHVDQVDLGGQNTYSTDLSAAERGA
jgi:prepilin-type N-terminal cleavage/methylation domain-containing protein